MDEEEYERRQEELARHAASEGAWYYDPDSPTLWKRFILGPVPLWRRLLWSIFPPSFQTLMHIQRRRSDKMWEEATAYLRAPKRSTKNTGKMGLFDRLFPRREVRTALQSISELEKALPSSLGLHLGFDAIKASLRREVIHKPDELRRAIQATNYSIKVLVLIRARNII